MKYFKSFLYSVFIVLLMSSCSSFDKDLYFKNKELLSKKNRVAVLPFKNASTDANSGRNVSDALVNELIKIKEWEILERELLTRIIKEQSMEATGLTSNDYSKLGQLLNVDYFITGSVNQYQYRINDSRTTSVRIALNVRFIDTTKGQIVGAGRYNYKVNRKFLNSCCVSSFFLNFMSDEDVEIELSNLSKKIVKDIQSNLKLK